MIKPKLGSRANTAPALPGFDFRIPLKETDVVAGTVTECIDAECMDVAGFNHFTEAAKYYCFL